jgi:hypothetical protein
MTSSAKAAESSPRKSGLSRLADRLETSRDRWLDDFPGWVEHRLAGVTWSRQREIAGLLRAHRRVGVRACHASGKTWLAAALVAWWIDTHPPAQALAVITAPSHDQIHGAMFHELKQIHEKAALPGKILGNDRWVLDDGTLVGVGRRPTDPAAMQGYHRPFVLAVIDEAAGVDDWVFTSAETITTGPQCRILAITNPDDPASAFAKTLTSEVWKHVKIDAFDTPAFTKEPVPPFLLDGRLIDQAYVDEKRIQWGTDSPLWHAKIEAEFSDSEDALIPYSWVTAAQRRWREWNDSPTRDTEQPHGRRVFGVDPAGPGRDRTALATRQGHVVMSVDSYQHLDTTQIAGLVEAKLRGTVQGLAVIDVVGLGTGVVDQLRRAKCNIHAFNGSHATRRTDATGEWRFPNARSASWWHCRQLLDPALDGKLALPVNDNLAAELCAPRYEYRAGGIIAVEPKEETKRRIGRSPDLADATVYATWTDLGDAHRDYNTDRPELRPVQYRAVHDALGYSGRGVFEAADFNLPSNEPVRTHPRNW